MSSAADWTGLFKMKKSNFRLLLLLAFYGLFLILGAAIFSAIESPLEVAEVKNMRDRKNHFIRTHTCITGKCWGRKISFNRLLLSYSRLASSSKFKRVLPPGIYPASRVM